ncbi:hypothetical protein [Mesorhizobium sp.]|uniref:hypothetical protein n=1 Tax=Mesorhizobium sp. TaxID=1871066 RepID=UPI000FE6FAAE|nr:hypothetical protein [Mesorhizobium sp.]RWA72202.1 MAG: hypothetical protein EOQ29_08550 [Mesorhizobium sp.]RWA76125.1 MAG: hypothetical protein EOQ30_34780 [Mesorhizobium sp.]RWB20648.1 MAG: hypothetical protein EOQ40_13585 [Mesorhizobium sp.]TIS46091.1 MAG: hypothetical protein E5W96_29230 [Mesorhizobium sp.]
MNALPPSFEFRSPFEFQSSGPSSSPVRTHSGALAPDPAEPPAPRFTGTAGAAPPSAPAPNSGASCIRTEDGTVILFDRVSGRAVSGLTRAAAEAALLRLRGAAPEQFQEKCEAVFRPELRQNNEMERSPFP